NTSSPVTLEKSGYARFRDLAGPIVSQLATFKLDKVVIETHGLSPEEERALLIGLELASYSYAENRDNPKKTRKKLPALLLKTSEALDSREIGAAARLAFSMNVARHLTNIPGGELNPRTYSDAVVDLFEGLPDVDVEVWQGEKLRQENMNLLLAVGGAATEGPRLVRISYRPKSAAAGTRPVAIVGKGITFDSGGLDIKPSSGMRWMKKDMGGSAASVGLAYWAVSSGLALPLDVYLSIAENAIGSASFRPGDVITARSGVTVEIGNTDAEGRLVLADALDVAVNAEEKPQALIDIATLTGAIKVGLGAEIAGLFANDDSLATEIEEAGRRTGDLSWRMPLFQPYKSMLRSTFADTNNCSDGGFGGAITAALFLEMFVKDIPWAHLDIYAWKDGAGGAFAESGGNGQPIQALSRVLSRMADGAMDGHA
ncbi:MAG: leucyl aminopeptidase family protein, partial [Bdellovibrionota bacterium]